MLVKHYGADPEDERRYSPARYVGSEKRVIQRNPDPSDIAPSYAERQNLTMRMMMRRFTRLTNAFSKKIQNHQHAIALYFFNYNFCRIHQTLKVTPAMAAGVTSKLWELEDVLGLLD